MQITIRSLTQTLSDVDAYADRLAAVRDADQEAFLDAAWPLMEAVAPVCSSPLSYLLDDLTIREYGKGPRIDSLTKHNTLNSLGGPLWRACHTSMRKRA